MSNAPENAAKRMILARRAQFMAAAMATVSIACGKSSLQPDAATDADAVPITFVPVPTAEPEPAVPPVSTSDDPPSVLDAGRPRPCLSPPHRPSPPGCDPPYMVTPDGLKRFKPECF